MRLIATRSFSYATRRLAAGDEFEAPGMIARALIGVKKARANEAPGPTPRQQPQPAPPARDEREALRELAEAKGLEVDRRWGVDRLQEEIARTDPQPGEGDALQ
jgi:hypothetical protein